MADDVAPAEQDKPINDAEAPDTGQAVSAEEESFIDSFDLNAVPEDARPHVEALQKEWQGKYTQTRQAEKQEIAEARREAQSKAQIVEALQSGNPDVARAILSQLGYDANAVLQMYGYATDDGDDDFTDPDEQLRREVQQLRQERETEKESREREAQESAVTDYIAEGIESLEKREKREFDREEHQALDALSRQFPKEVGGRMVPDYEGAYDLLHGIVKSGNKRLIDGKDAPRRPGGGSAGSRTVDLSKESDEEFLERTAAAADQARASAQ